MGIPVYHITDFENLAAILEKGALISKSRCAEEHTVFKNISHDSVQNIRSAKTVPIRPNTTLHDYVPFYFAPRSPMLYAIHRGNVESYKKPQSEIVYLQSDAKAIETNGSDFVYTNRNATLANADFFDDLDHFPLSVDEDILKVTMWQNTPEDGDRKARRQAEFLVKNSVDLQHILGIGVFDQKHNDLVTGLLASSKFPSIRTGIKRGWYF